MLLQRRTTYAATKVPSNAIPIVANSDGGGGSSPAGVALLLVLFDAMVHREGSVCSPKLTSDFLGFSDRIHKFEVSPPHPTRFSFANIHNSYLQRNQERNIQQQHDIQSNQRIILSKF